MKLHLCTADYILEDYRPVVVFFCRDKYGRRRIVKSYTFSPYFYIPIKAIPTLQDVASRLGIKFKISRTKFKPFEEPDLELVKIITQLPRDVGRLSKRLISRRIMTYEGDIVFRNRVLIDTGIKSGLTIDEYGNILGPVEMDSKIKSVAIDVEVDAKSLTDLQEYRGELIVLTIYDFSTSIYHVISSKLEEEDKKKIVDELSYFPIKDWNIRFYKAKDEKDLLNRFVEIWRQIDPDVAETFTEFDFFFLATKLGRRLKLLSPISRAYLMKDRMKIYGVEIFDIAKAYKRAFSKELKFVSLQYVAEQLGTTRLYHREDVHRLWNSNDYYKVVVRNIIDVALIRLAEETWYLLEMFDTIRRLVGFNITDGFYPSRCADMLYLRYFSSRGIALPSKSLYPKRKYSGAEVFKPKSGVHRNVAVYDFKQMYPSIMISFNIGWETFTKVRPSTEDYIEIDSEHYFLTSARSSAVEIIKVFSPLMDENKRQIKEAMSRGDEVAVKRLKARRLGLKAIVNGIYGFFGYSGNYEEKIPASRFYHPDIAEAVTTLGRELVTLCARIANDLGYEVIYGDTDSIFIKIDTSSFKEDAERLVVIIDSRLKDLLKERYKIEEISLELDVDKLFKKLILFKKKKYAGLTVEGIVEVTGLKIVRSDVPQIVVDAQKDLVKMIFEDRSREEIRKYIEKTVSSLPSRDLLEYAIPTRVTKIETLTLPVKALIFSNQILKLNIRLLERFYLLHLKSIRGYPSTVVVEDGLLKGRSFRVRAVAFRDPTDLPSGLIIDYERHKDLVRKSLIPFYKIARHGVQKTLLLYS